MKIKWPQENNVRAVNSRRSNGVKAFWSRLIRLLIRQPTRAASTYAGGHVNTERARPVSSRSLCPAHSAETQNKGIPGHQSVMQALI